MMPLLASPGPYAVIYTHHGHDFYGKTSRPRTPVRALPGAPAAPDGGAASPAAPVRGTPDIEESP
jgi:hypothetical protein